MAESNETLEELIARVQSNFISLEIHKKMLELPEVRSAIAAIIIAHMTPSVREGEDSHRMPKRFSDAWDLLKEYDGK